MTTTIRQYTSALLLAAAIVPFMIGAAEAEEFLLGATVHFTQDKGILDVNLKLARDCNLNAIREAGVHIGAKGDVHARIVGRNLPKLTHNAHIRGLSLAVRR